MRVSLLCVFVCLNIIAQIRTVAVTVDDLPFAGAAHGAEADNRKLLAAFQRHRVPTVGFVIQQHVESMGAVGSAILREWTRLGFELGNHTYTHADSNALSMERFEQEIVKGEGGRHPKFFRFPMNHAGDTKEKHDTWAEFLAQRGYKLAVCTIENSDYLFNQAYVRMLVKNDMPSAEKLRAGYLTYTSAEIDYYAALDKQVLGYAPAEIMLLHDNALNAAVIEQLLSMFEEKQFRFVTLDTALSDPAYHAPDTYVTKFGPMWGYRWAAQRGVKVNGSLEPDPPQWILDYGK
jgi:peptidoglycan/xylan/chitin deacetylase (PgdA/CDA1 family)